MPPLPIALNGLTLTLSASPLTPEAFAPFGSVIQNPRPDIHPSRIADLGPSPASSPPPLPYDAVSANQGTAIKYQHVTRMTNHYPTSSSTKPAGVAVMNLFVCAARPAAAQVHVKILERHPYTTQTFSPLATSSKRYLVIVAPNALVGGAGGAERPPDLARLRAFVASSEQAVTYAAGTWHAPMIALGDEGEVGVFVVTQFANGVADDDCQEVVLGGDGKVVVEVPLVGARTMSKL